MDLLGILICKWKGHKRRRRLKANEPGGSWSHVIRFRCPRCGDVEERPVRGKG